FDMVFFLAQEDIFESPSGLAAGIWNNNAIVWLSTHHRDILPAGRRMTPLGTQDMDKFTTITVEQHGAIEILSLNRPDALNAVTPTMADELIAYFSGLHDRLSTRIVILRGNGRAFCAGAELGSDAFAAPGEGRPQRQLDMQQRYSRIIRPNAS